MGRKPKVTFENMTVAIAGISKPEAQRKAKSWRSRGMSVSMRKRADGKYNVMGARL